jgi:hypothetical protein
MVAYVSLNAVSVILVLLSHPGLVWIVIQSIRQVVFSSPFEKASLAARCRRKLLL